jgi:hypothetical protein
MEDAKFEDANFPTGSSGLVAVDKIGNQILFLDPLTYVTALTLDAFAPRVHELAISPDHRTAYVPIYGEGIHGKNPHPGHLIAVLDLVARRHAGDFSTCPYLAPHGLRWGPLGQLYCVCEDSGVLLEIDAGTGSIKQKSQERTGRGHASSPFRQRIAEGTMAEAEKAQRRAVISKGPAARSTREIDRTPPTGAFDGPFRSAEQGPSRRLCVQSPSR